MIKRPFRASAPRPAGSARGGPFRALADYALAAAILGFLAIVAVRFERVATATVQGVPFVSDGDTLTLSGERIRLKGIDAPELAQICAAAGQDYPCGRRARAALAEIIGARSVSCSGWERDRYRRLVASCRTARGVELNRRLVELGWAVGYGGYADVERAARNQRLGLWAGTFERPHDWRVQHGALAEGEHDLLRRIANWLRQVFR